MEFANKIQESDDLKATVFTAVHHTLSVSTILVNRGPLSTTLPSLLAD